MTSAPNVHVIRSAPSPVSLPSPDPIGAGRMEINPTARLRFDELRGQVARISGTMLGTSATRAADEQAATALSEIEALAKAARVALGGKS